MSEVNLELPHRLKPHLRLDSETGEVVARLDEERLRQIVREEISAALERQDQHGLDNLLTAIDADPAPDDEIVAVLAEMTVEEWETLVQRVKARRKAEEEAKDLLNWDALEQRVKARKATE